MKIFQIILITTLVICIHNTCLKTEEPATSNTECHNRPLSDGEKAGGAAYCCYFDYLDGNHEDKSCIPFNQNQYDNMEDTIKAFENLMEVKILSIDCKSSYLQIGLLGLLFFLF